MSQPGVEQSETPGKRDIINNLHAECVQQQNMLCPWVGLDS